MLAVVASSDDPLLQPFMLKHLNLRNRVLSSSHEPAYSVEGMPKDRYRLYHVEKAKGGVAMTMTAGDKKLSDCPFYWAARADLERRAERHADARSIYERAIALARNAAERVSYERRLKLLDSW